MKIFISGICGFVGTALARALAAAYPGIEISGIDNFIRPGSETNRATLKTLGVRLQHGDIRAATIPVSPGIVLAHVRPYKNYDNERQGVYVYKRAKVLVDGRGKK